MHLSTALSRRIFINAQIQQLWELQSKLFLMKSSSSITKQIQLLKKAGAKTIIKQTYTNSQTELNKNGNYLETFNTCF